MEQNKEVSEMTVEELEKIIKQKQSLEIQFKHLRHNGSVKSTIENFQMLLDHYSITIKYNEMSKDMEIDIPNKDFHNDIHMNGKISELRSLAQLHNFPVQDIDNYVISIGNNNSYHPVRQWIESNDVWDGKDRLQDYYDSIILDEPNTMKEVMMRKWALSLMGALYHHNFSCEGVLTFSGEQGKGKTIWIENIIPKEYHNEWNKDAVVIDTKNKDSISKALRYWITELGEVDATFKRSDIEALKGFITEKVDVIRNPYERKSNTYARRTVFYATVNDEEFLRDAQNRRFWVLGIKGFNHGTIDVAQFWAQIRAIYMTIKDKIGSGADREKYQEWGWFMSPNERKLMEPLQERYKTVDPIEELLEKFIEPAGDGEFMSCTEILQQCSFGMPGRPHTNIASKYLKKNGYERQSDTKKWKVKFKSVLEEKVLNFDKFKKKGFGNI